MVNLPKLPRVLKKKEAAITPRVMKWFEDNYPFSVAVEVKIRGNAILSHQDVALNQVQTGSFSYKIRDSGARNPFDFFVLKQADAFVVTCDGKWCEAVCKDSITRFNFSL